MRVTLESNLDKVISFTERLHPQFQFAAAVALTKSVKDVQTELYSEMERVWDRPTPFSKRSLFIKPATKVNLEAVVEIKDRFPSKAQYTPQQVYQHQYFGGARQRTGLEKYCTSAGLLGATEMLVPASGAKLDAYGNMARGQTAQVMSQLRLGLDPASFKSKSRRSKASMKRAGRFFWSRGGHLKRGVWVAQGYSIAPVLLVSSRHTYKARMNIERTSKAVMDRVFPAHLARAFEMAKRSAR